MTYQEYKPTKKLEPLIDAYWSFSNLKEKGDSIILPDSSMDIIFNFGNVVNSISKNSIGISGMMTKFSKKTFDEHSNLFGIRFKSGMLSKFTKYPLFELKNKMAEAAEIIPAFNVELLEKLEQHGDAEQKIQLLEDELPRLLHTEQTPNDRLIFSVISFIKQSSEPVLVKDIAERHYISLRQLERRFKHKVGVTLKEYVRITRFIKTKAIIESQSKENLLHIAFDNGYYDHAHLTNEFKLFSGKTPSEFR